MRNRYPNFRRAQRERCPYYDGPPIRPLRFFTTGFIILLALMGITGAALGWFW